MSNGVVKFAEFVGTITEEVWIEAFLAIPIYTDKYSDNETCIVEFKGHHVRHNEYTIHPLSNSLPKKLSDKFLFYINYEQSGLNIFLQTETVDSVTHLYLCADSRVLPKIIINTYNNDIKVESMELRPSQDVMIEREDIALGTTNRVVLPIVSMIYG